MAGAHNVNNVPTSDAFASTASLFTIHGANIRLVGGVRYIIMTQALTTAERAELVAHLVAMK